MSSTTYFTDDRIQSYILESSLREPAVLRRLREETAKLPMSAMQIAPEQGQFMRLLVRMLNARRTLEVGVFTGYSTLSVALALPADGQVVACDVSEEWTAVARRYWQEAGVAERIALHLAPAVQTLDRLLAEGQAETFDFAFIDADKASYDAYYERSLHLLRRGGVIAVDNVLWDGRTADPSNHEEDTVAIRALNEKILGDDRVEISMLPIADGLTLAFKK